MDLKFIFSSIVVILSLGFIFFWNSSTTNDDLYADFYDEITRIDKYNMRFTMFNTATKFAHIYLYKEDKLVKYICWDVYDKNLQAAYEAVQVKYSDCDIKIFVSRHKKDYRKCLSKL